MLPLSCTCSLAREDVSYPNLLFSVMLAALQRRPVLYHIRWSLTVHWLCFSEQ